MLILPIFTELYLSPEYEYLLHYVHNIHQLYNVFEFNIFFGIYKNSINFNKIFFLNSYIFDSILFNIG